MTTIIGISGSLRRGSLNSALLRAAAELAPEGVAVEVVSFRDFPLYDGDLESERGIPEPVAALQAAIAAADALLIATPEYNRSIPGPLKNALDWLSRGDGSVISTAAGKPVGVIGAAPGRFGTGFAQVALLPVLRQFAWRVYTGKQLHVSGAEAFADGELEDEAMRDRVAGYMAGLAGFIRGPDA